MDKAEYDRRKAQLKAKKEKAGKALEQARGAGGLAYAKAVNTYTAAQEALNEFIQTHGLYGTANGHPPAPTREERRKDHLRRRGITPVWDRPPQQAPAVAAPPKPPKPPKAPKAHQVPKARRPLPENFVRAGAMSICPTCNKKYIEHPLDTEVLSYQDQPFLRILCNGLRVKL